MLLLQYVFGRYYIPQLLAVDNNRDIALLVSDARYAKPLTLHCAIALGCAADNVIYGCVNYYHTAHRHAIKELVNSHHHYLTLIM